MKRILVFLAFIVVSSSYAHGQPNPRSKSIQQELMRLQRAAHEAEDKKDLAVARPAPMM
jgi:hypothetical protein